MTSTLTPAGELARRAGQATGGARPGRPLRRGSLRFPRTAALPAGIQCPAAGVTTGPPVIA
ncbi:MAG TPA: hypothetical protein VMV92_15975 [Streptosporangiaceae bacterium]|nr:hypothetical protein [Streptosporangiaceae bacterium]